ncbi:helix-turn-helix domain-containing protein [Vreelandella indica]|uniref:helix-turn-helix domain-containing protein n=1 Tax=Vreelandella indica TaxID=3126500 RepID=UPI00300E54A1
MARYPWQYPTASISNTAGSNTPCHLQSQAYLPESLDCDQVRLAAMEQDEPKRRLIRDAAALRKQRGITQVQMAEELGVPCRTLEEWLQGRRYPKGPGQTLLCRWLEGHRSQRTGHL